MYRRNSDSKYCSFWRFHKHQPTNFLKTEPLSSILFIDLQVELEMPPKQWMSQFDVRISHLYVQYVMYVYRLNLVLHGGVSVSVLFIFSALFLWECVMFSRDVDDVSSCILC